MRARADDLGRRVCARLLFERPVRLQVRIAEPARRIVARSNEAARIRQRGDERLRNRAPAEIFVPVNPFARNLVRERAFHAGRLVHSVKIHEQFIFRRGADRFR